MGNFPNGEVSIKISKIMYFSFSIVKNLILWVCKVLYYDQKIMKSCVSDMSLISGQMPIITKSKKSISNFKTKKGFNAGVKVTLRKNKMYEFLDRLINIALPRIKDFKGLNPNSFDLHGNFSFGIKEHIVFPEINFDKVEKIRGLDITIVTNSNNKEQNLGLLSSLNLPFLNNKKKESNWGLKWQKKAQYIEIKKGLN